MNSRIGFGSDLHNAENKEAAILLIESVKPEQRREYLDRVDKEGCTALHIAASHDRTGVVKLVTQRKLIWLNISAVYVQIMMN